MARLQKKKKPADKGRKKDLAKESLSGTGVRTEAENKAKSVTPALKQAAKSQEKKGKSTLSASAAEKEPNIFQKGIQFFREVKIELKKVTWPNRKQTAGSTVVVIILVFIIASFLGLVDFGLSKLVQIVLA